MSRTNTNTKTKFIFVTGGVVSSLGKGVASASIGALLEALANPEALENFRGRPELAAP